MNDLLSGWPTIWVPLQASKNHIAYNLWTFLRNLQTQQDNLFGQNGTPIADSL